MMQDKASSVEEWFSERQRVSNVELAVSSPLEAAKAIVAGSCALPGTHIHLINAYSIALAQSSPDYREALSSPAINLPDGKPVSWASRFLRHYPRLSQVRGPQLFLDIFDLGRQANLRHFLLGSTPQVLDALQENLVTSFPGTTIVGAESPPFRPMTTDERARQDERIVASGADVVWVGLGTPKQDYEAARLATSTGITTIAVGAAFDFAAGTLPEAPEWMKKAGLEWAFRFATEPRRLWRRYLIGNFVFLRAIFRQATNG
ncbi:WecB/TagA/CpsF family glycosyltransferase [Paenarthrobacter sp. DKR-5]|uniref:WecB/TagA/CpsF family glycosyltransferase n=1 Tax=Paenarthrobacter sp. DKR-5 TaxID=2835535 RepID=UPI001BDD6747|nr:WecB/TagA/CpsF family glycosyltransferase [Paenarthrobacter sp. DKR-5]MBT1002786.1 WecB/TagA/CpsF family glycosyltransferase [Paenarthrobacter sp. DKR-5]